MGFNAHFNLQPTEAIKQAHGLGENGKIQAFVDSECIRLMEQLTPWKNGIMAKKAKAVAPGHIEQDTPYAQFQYYGKVMTTEDGRVWAKKNEAKPIITARNLVHSTAKHPQAGPFWFERMKEANKEIILRGAEEVAKRT